MNMHESLSAAWDWGLGPSQVTRSVLGPAPRVIDIHFIGENVQGGNQLVTKSTAQL